MLYAETFATRGETNTSGSFRSAQTRPRLFDLFPFLPAFRGSRQRLYRRRTTCQSVLQFRFCAVLPRCGPFDGYGPRLCGFSFLLWPPPGTNCSSSSLGRSQTLDQLYSRLTLSDTPVITRGQIRHRARARQAPRGLCSGAFRDSASPPNRCGGGGSSPAGGSDRVS